jgi:hypothetical protein
MSRQRQGDSSILCLMKTKTSVVRQPVRLMLVRILGEGCWRFCERSYKQ